MWSYLALSLFDNKFPTSLRNTLKSLELTVKEFSKISNIPVPTLYKVMSNKGQKLNVSTVIKIVNTIRKMEGFEDSKKVIGVISTRQTLDTLRDLSYENVKLIRYPATTIEEEIIQGVNAERDGVIGLIAGPIATTTLCKVVKIPIMSIPFELSALEVAIKRLIREV